MAHSRWDELGNGDMHMSTFRKTAGEISGHKVYQVPSGYCVVDPQTGRTTMILTGEHNPGPSQLPGFYVNTAITKDNRIKMIELYLFLILEKGLVMYSGDQQTPGSEKVWRQLAQHPGIVVERYNTNRDRRDVRPLYSRWRDHYKDDKQHKALTTLFRARRA